MIKELRTIHCIDIGRQCRCPHKVPSKISMVIHPGHRRCRCDRLSFHGLDHILNHIFVIIKLIVLHAMMMNTLMMHALVMTINTIEVLMVMLLLMLKAIIIFFLVVVALRLLILRLVSKHMPRGDIEINSEKSCLAHLVHPRLVVAYAVAHAFGPPAEVVPSRVEDRHFGVSKFLLEFAEVLESSVKVVLEGEGKSNGCKLFDLLLGNFCCPPSLCARLLGLEFASLQSCPICQYFVFFKSLPNGHITISKLGLVLKQFIELILPLGLQLGPIVYLALGTHIESNVMQRLELCLCHPSDLGVFVAGHDSLASQSLCRAPFGEGIVVTPWDVAVSMRRLIFLQLLKLIQPLLFRTWNGYQHFAILLSAPTLRITVRQRLILTIRSIRTTPLTLFQHRHHGSILNFQMFLFAAFQVQCVQF
mmetsp:Transcript_43717/g.74641  ORF Transcript_43717/g.74641 Transcript_43717/m.74641 type:complete len:419 (+) Transcript_43717:239-1495(+)